MKHLRFFVLCFGLLLMLSNAALADAVPEWKLGDSWHIKVELPTGEMGPRPKIAPEKSLEAGKREPFDIHVVILGRQKVKKIDCVKVDFILPGKQKPEAVHSFRYRVFIDPQDGFPRQAYSFKDYRSMPLRDFGKARFVTAAPTGIPLDFLPLTNPLEAEARNAKLVIKRTVDKETETTTQSTVFYQGNEAELEIRETWKDGERWWRTYERYRKGKLDLRAWQVIKPKEVAKAPKPAPKKPAPIAAPPKGKVVYPPFVDETNDPLRRDPRLQVKVTMKLRNPRAHHILTRLAEATKLTFSADENVDSPIPVFGALECHNKPVWAVMNSVAESPNVKGRWEKVDGGYRLVGKTQQSEGELYAAADRTDLSAIWVLFVAAGIAFVVAGLFLVPYVWGKLKKPAAQAK